MNWKGCAGDGAAAEPKEKLEPAGAVAGVAGVEVLALKLKVDGVPAGVVDG